MTYGTIVYDMVHHVTQSNSRGVVSINGAHNAEPAPQTRQEHEPCSLAHMAVSAARLWRMRTDAGMPEQDLLQALIFDASPVRITEVLGHLVRRGELHYAAGCYHWVGVLPVIPSAQAPEIALPPVPDHPFAVGKKGYGHMLRQADPSRALCGHGVEIGWKWVAHVTPRWRCSNCLRSQYAPIARFGEYP